MEYKLRAMDFWYREWPGAMLVDRESVLLQPLLANTHGEYLLQVGGPSNLSLAAASPIENKIYVAPQYEALTEGPRIQCDLEALSIKPNSVNAIILAHQLAFAENPKHVLSEIFQAMAPNGLLIVLGFNPWSLWGVARHRRQKKGFPWQGTFWSSPQVKRWLRAIGYRVITQKTLCYCPPVHNRRQAERWRLLETMGPYCLPNLGGAYLIAAQKRVVATTMIMDRLWETGNAYKNRLKSRATAPVGNVSRMRRP